MNVFHETTSAAIKSYFPQDLSAAEFLHLINSWWLISNSKSKYSNNYIGYANVRDDKKPELLGCFLKWINEWQIKQLKECGKFTLSKQTANAMIKTLKSSADLCDDLLNEGYTYILTSRFQSDSLER